MMRIVTMNHVRGVANFAKRVRVPKAVRNTIISSIILLVILIAGGAAYVYWTGQGVPVNNDLTATVPIATPEPVVKPPVPAPNARVGVAVQAVTSPIEPGSDASITVRTTAGATCTITAIYNQVPSTDPGLHKQMSDEYGTVSWTWAVEASVPVGIWPVTVTCARNGQSGVVSADLNVAKTL